MVLPVKSQTNSTTLPVPGTLCPSSLASVRVRVRFKVKFGDDKVRSFQCDVFYPEILHGFWVLDGRNFCIDALDQGFHSLSSFIFSAFAIKAVAEKPINALSQL